ncbi:MAG: 3-deoxy-7-phosphoheptulonate synthase [Acidobacteria bacterium]|nr:3-deoxy-7-phosphoheptulonate synthase [Acidobacteriota bacterium]
MSSSLRLVTHEAKQEKTLVHVGASTVGGEKFVIMAGPCAVESREMLLETADRLHHLGVTILRGGAFKPRTSPYSFQGLREEGLRILAEARERTGMSVVTEVLSVEHVPVVAEYADILQIGARNMQNFELLKACGEVRNPVLLKRGLAATLEEFLAAAEYILAGGNEQVILCERGIRTFSNHSRFTLDLSLIPVLKQITHLPIIVDPSHGMGDRRFVAPMALAGIAAGADGLMVEVHPNPEKALSDGPQSLYFEQLEKLIRDLEVISPVVGRQLDLSYKLPTEAKWTKTRPLKVAYQGEPGAFSERAVHQYFGETASPQSRISFREVFEAVQTRQCDYGVIPIENSLSGSIHENYDLLLEYDVAIIGEFKMRIVHNLIAHEGTRLEDIRRIYAHPQAIAQCRVILSQYPEWEINQVYDTAGSVKYIKEHHLMDAAAIASAQAAENLGMAILKEGVESNPQNYTRFLVISPEHVINEKANKTSLIYNISNTPGALFDTLQKFAANNVNLVKLESRPRPGRPWEYMFYVDLEGSLSDPVVSQTIDELRSMTEFLKVLGSYPASA